MQQLEEFLTRAGLLWLNGAVIGTTFLAQALPFIMAVGGAVLFLMDRRREAMSPRIAPPQSSRPARHDFTIS